MCLQIIPFHFFFVSLFVAVLVDNFQRTITAVEVKPHKKHSGVQFKSVFDEVRYRLRTSLFPFPFGKSQGKVARKHGVMGYPHQAWQAVSIHVFRSFKLNHGLLRRNQRVLV